MFNNERFVIVWEDVTVRREYMVRITDGNNPLESVEDLDKNQEYIDASDKELSGPKYEPIRQERELPLDWQSDPTLLKYARFIMDNNGLLDANANAVPVKKKRRKRKNAQDSVDNETKSDIMSEPNWSQLAKEMNDG